MGLRDLIGSKNRMGAEDLDSPTELLLNWNFWRSHAFLLFFTLVLGFHCSLSGQGIEGTLPSSRKISVAEIADLLLVLSAMCSVNSASPTLPSMNGNAFGKRIETGGLKFLKLLIAGKIAC